MGYHLCNYQCSQNCKLLSLFGGGGFGTMSHLKADMGARQKSKMSMVWAASEQKLVLLEESEEKNALAPLTITKAQT